MEIKDFIEKFIEAVDIEETETLSEKTEFKLLDEWTSLEALSLIAMIHDEYGVSITNQNIRELTTIEDLFIFVSHLADNA